MGSVRLGLLDDLFQQIDVIGEGFSTGDGQRAGRERAVVLKGFGYSQVTGLLQSADVCRQVAIGHAERVPQFGEREVGRRSQQRHDRQPPLLVNHTIELQEGFWIHASFFFSVKCK